MHYACNTIFSATGIKTAVIMTTKGGQSLAPPIPEGMLCDAGIHLCCWGKVEPSKKDAVDMTIGLPKPSLLPLGLGDIPEDYVLTIPVRGSSQQPDVGFGR
jgi:hypothetical protein